MDCVRLRSEPNKCGTYFIDEEIFERLLINFDAVLFARYTVRAPNHFMNTNKAGST